MNRKKTHISFLSHMLCTEIISKKYVNINGKVSKDKWQSMFRYFVKYVKTMYKTEFWYTVKRLFTTQ